MSFMRVFGSIFFLCTLVSAPNGWAAPKKKPAQTAEEASAASGAYKGAIVVDAASGKTLFEDNSDVVSPPASVTKLMTFAIVKDRLKAGSITLDTPVTVTADEAGVGGTQVFLAEKEIFSVEDLLYAMLIQSANDAAASLARASAGSREAFVALMNQKAAELGMVHTTFRSPHGLPPTSRKLVEGDLTTPRDLALLSRYLLLSTDVLKYTSVRARDFGTGKRKEPQHMINHNHLLGKVAGVDGLKTGFTNGAGFCLAATALRNNKRIIVVLMGSTNNKSRDLRVAELLERGFASLPADSKFNGPSAPPAKGDSPVSGPSPISPVSADTKSSPVSAPPVAPSPAPDTPPVVRYPGSTRKP